MMRSMSNKANVKTISIFVAVIFVLGVAGLAYMQMETPSMAAPSTTIGIIDTSKVITGENPDVVKAREELMKYSQELQTKFDAESATLDDQGKQELFTKLQADLRQKETEVQKAMEDKVKDATKSVADAKGLTMVLNKAAVLYGGVDITDAVAKKLNATEAKEASTK